MSHACFISMTYHPGRLEQLVAVCGLAVGDRLRESAESASEQEGCGPAALVHLCAHPSGSIRDLQSVIGLTQTGTGRLVERLVNAGLVERRAGPDARTQSLWLTVAGEARAELLLRRRREVMELLLEPLTGEERADLERLLGRVVGGLAYDRSTALSVCRLCDRSACRSGPGCPLEHTTRDAEL
jgi:DNA-binding MarR family transcriptional regulator